VGFAEDPLPLHDVRRRHRFVSSDPPETVDVILPTYCRPHTIRYAIQSVLAQTYPHFVLHVVCDGCDRDSESAVLDFNDPRVRFYRFPKAAGFGYVHRNEVLQKSDAPYVAYMTDDDLWFPEHLERALERIRTKDLDLVAFRSIQVRFPETLDPYFFAFDWPFAFLRNWFMGSVNCVHRRTIFDVVGYWNDALSRFGDREFYNRVRTSSARSEYVDRVTLLRFYAQTWDSHYERLAPPQARYIEMVSDPRWREAVDRSLESPRGWRVRVAQLADFKAFALRSGPKFVRFWYENLRSRRTV
jgi:glycosyltransferase involved in cell wall biosynthesis